MLSERTLAITVDNLSMLIANYLDKSKIGINGTNALMLNGWKRLCILDIIINDAMLTLHIASQSQSSKKLNIFDYNNKSIIIYIKNK
jgi:hypothetical protein